jgi:transcription-repair coupling factor (superfamily II helicase)
VAGSNPEPLFRKQQIFMPKPASLIEALASSVPFRQVSRSRAARKSASPPVVLENVLAEAHAHFVSVLALGAAGQTWVVCDNPRAQERIFSVLQQWVPTAIFFPDAPEAPVDGVIADPAVSAERLSALEELQRGPSAHPQCILLTFASLESQVPSPEGLQSSGLHLRRGQRVDRADIIAGLEKQGYELVPQVAERGQIAVRGGILDLFGFQHARPVRLELFGDEIESIRAFDLDAQTSVEVLEECTLLSLDAGEAGLVSFLRLIGPGDRVVFSDAFHLGTHSGEDDRQDSPVGAWLRKRSLPGGECFAVLTGGAATRKGRVESDSVACYETGLGPFNAGDFIVDEHKREQFSKQLKEWREGEWNVFLFCRSEGEQERLQEMLEAAEVKGVTWCLGDMPGGFVCPGASVAVLCDGDLLGRSARHVRARRRGVGEVLRRTMPDFAELVEGELVVHLDHGIARFEELREIPREGATEQVLVLSFAHNAKVYVPLEQSALVSRYVGIGKRNPPLSELGDGKWARARKSAEQAVYQYAGRLLTLHAERELSAREAHPADNRWVRDFEDAFPYEETPDQLSAIAAAKVDMESPRPMDRLICGDVGFGKTEIAIRAAFKAVMGGRQVALLVPTTVLAEQHYRNFRERMSAFPVRIEMLSRFRTPAEQRRTIEGLSDGSVDIVVGTHRLLSTKLEFKNLGLVVIDEEQRFGVLHKERLKERFRLVDQLTLSATPIPRTLYLSLMGAKDMSTLETPPANRIPVETFVCPYDERIIRDAIQREVARDGQVYFLHNRIESIHRVKERLEKLLPKVRCVVGHGQMDEEELEEVMQTFLEGRADVLISTTIIESGLDIPNANTILIDRADRFGLADLYQLRGRVGRSDRQAYAYLLLPRALLSTGEARKRINAIKQYSSLGAGFKIALRDLEIRGAGNILGTQQSGHICAIGFELYCSLLKQAMAAHKGEAGGHPEQAASHLDFVASREADFLAADAGTKAPAFLPASFLEDAGTRIAAYRALSGAKDESTLDSLAVSWRDRFGMRLPEAVENLLCVHAVRTVAGARGISRLEVKDSKVMCTRGGDYVLIGNKFPRLSSRTDPSARLPELLDLVRKL